MIHAKQNLISLLVVSLLVAVISLPGAVSLAAVAPKAQAMSPIREGMVTPVRIALHPSGSFYVTDARGKAILKYNVYGQLVQTIKTAEIPLGITLAQNNDIVVTQGKYVAVLDPAGNERYRTSGYIAKAIDVAVDGKNNICVTDGGTHQVHVFSSTCSWLKTFGGEALALQDPAYGKFSRPTAIVYEKDSQQIAVADTLNGRIQFFDINNNYQFVRKVGIGGLNDEKLDFVSVQGFAFEYDQNNKLTRMYVADAWKSTVQAIDPLTPAFDPTYGTSAGTFLSQIGAGNIPAGTWVKDILGGVEDWQFSVPTDVVYDSVNKRLLVTSENGSIQVVGIDGGVSPSLTSPHFLTIDAAPLNTSTSTYNISGTVKAGSTVVIKSTSGVVGPVTVSGAKWSASLSSLSVGATEITVEATDVTELKLTKKVTVVYAQTATSLTIANASGTVSSQTSYALSGTVGNAEATVTITNNRTGVTTAATVGGNKQWTGTVNLVPDVENSITVRAALTGYDTATASVAIISDTINPVLTLSALPAGAYSSGTLNQNISGFVTDTNPATVTVTVNGTTQPVISTPVKDALFSQAITLQAGTNTITVTATDKAGKASAVETRTIYYSSSYPVLTINAGPADNSFTKTTATTISGTVTPVAASVTINGVAVSSKNNTTGAWSGTLNLVSGLNTIEVKATSGTSASLKRTVILDTMLPDLAITSPATDASINVPNTTIKGTVSSGLDGYPTVTVKVGNNTPYTLSAITNGTFSFDTGGLVVGANTITVTATDAATGSTTVTRNITYDTTPPAIAMTKLMLGELTGTVEAGSVVTVQDGTTTFPTVTTGTTWTADLSAGYDKSTLKMTAVDAAGNPSVIYPSFPTGDYDGNGTVNGNDATYTMQAAVGTRTPTAAELQRADVGPLLNGKINPNGMLDIIDAMLILRISVGIPLP